MINPRQTAQKAEILAPAGGYESVEAAVRCGANAVYLGAKDLNARRGASNFTEEELARTVSYAHRYGVKVYLTFNTMLFDHELPQARQLLQLACGLGVDALIVQDAGVALLARQDAPGMRLHASTQMSVHHLDGAKRLEQLGFSRVVLARECSRTEIERIAAGTSLEIEVFVHGAFCMCISGQCYMSSVLGQRSGNRGLCAQPCRLPFSVGDQTNVLSLKDLTLTGHLGELLACGVGSLKIEGRMKRPEYVAAAVTACRQALEGEPVDLDTLRSVFSRGGFTDGYFTGHLGSEMFGIRGKEDVVAAGNVLGALQNLYHKDTPRVAVDMDFSMQAGEPIRLKATDGTFSAAVQGEEPQQALNRPTDQALADKNLAKTGSTPFFPREIRCEIGDGLMVPASALNSLRRDALEQLDALRAQTQPIVYAEKTPVSFPKTGRAGRPRLRGRFEDAASITQDIVDTLDEIAMPVSEVFHTFNNGLLKTEKTVVIPPRAMFDNGERVEKTLKKVADMGISRALCGNLAVVEMASRLGFEVIGDFGLNIANSLALKSFAQQGLTQAVVSFECSLARAKNLADFLPISLIAYGHLPLMLTRNCPVKNAVGCEKCGRSYSEITDRRGTRMKVRCDADRQAVEIYNPVALYLADRLEELNGFHALDLCFTQESPAEIRMIVNAYRNGGGKPDELTRGLYYREVL